MFKKIACMTDLHLGLKNNSSVHNKDCEDFIDWFIDTAKQEGCETGLCLGDWHHHRNHINMLTLQSSLNCLEKLGKAFDPFYFFPGNHDLYYKDKRDVHSNEFARHIPGISVITEITTIGNSSLVPWLVGDEWKKIEKLKSKYVFGHFELPQFYMNAMVQMPDHGELQSTHFKADYVFSGHFHKRQASGNVHYIGNAFPHNFADAWDTDRGMMILEQNGSPKYINWPDAPSYKTTTLSKLIDDADTIATPKSHLRVAIDIPITFEEATFIKDEFMSRYKIRELSLIPEKKDAETASEIDIEQFDSIDTIVNSQITSIQSDQFDPKVLLAIYNGL